MYGVFPFDILHFIRIDHVCSRNNFVCANGKCLDSTHLCDGKNDCGDSSDEGTICFGKIIGFGFFIPSSILIMHEKII